MSVSPASLSVLDAIRQRHSVRSYTAGKLVINPCLEVMVMFDRETGIAGRSPAANRPQLAA